MDPEKEALLPVLVDPRERLVDDEPAGPIVRETSRGVARHCIAIGLKAFVQAEAPIERKRGDECGGRKPGVRERFGERRCASVDPHAVVARPVPGWVAAGHEARVRGEGYGCRRVSAI